MQDGMESHFSWRRGKLCIQNGRIRRSLVIQFILLYVIPIIFLSRKQSKISKFPFTEQRSEFNFAMSLVIFTSDVLELILILLQTNLSSGCSLMRLYTWRSTTNFLDWVWNWTGAISTFFIRQGMIIFLSVKNNADNCHNRVITLLSHVI